MNDEQSFSRVTTLLCDVMGTVVDIDTPAQVAATTALASVGADAARVPGFVEDWNDRLQRLLNEVIAGRIAWRSHRALRREALEDAVASAGIDALASDVVERLVTVIHRAQAWPDAADALRRLRTTHAVVALSNADFAEIVDLSRLGGLGWHGIISTAASHSFKPDPGVYDNAIAMLGADPAAVMMVAAHPWDLRAAAQRGLATAYVARPGAEAPAVGDHFDLEVADLSELADRLPG